MTPADAPRLREIVFDVVRSEFPAEFPSLPAVWDWWLASPLRRAADQHGAALLPAIGRDGGSVKLAVILTLATVWAELEGSSILLDEPAVDRAVRAAGKALGVSGPMLDRIARRAVPNMVTILEQMRQPVARSARAPREVLAELWIEGWANGRATPLDSAPFDAIPGLVDRHSADLIVNEHARTVRGRTVTKQFSEIRPQGLAALWLALDRCGRSFGENDLRQLYSHDRVEDSSLRKIPMLARQLFAELLGKEILPKARGSVYEVPGGGWSWAWIRLEPEREKSQLLRSGDRTNE
jgi:hypothetical protein